MRLNQLTVGCTDYASAVTFYRTLGLTQIVDSSPRYARFETPGGETFSVHLVEKVKSDGVVIYFEVDDVDAKVVALEKAGLVFTRQPADESWLWREARLRDPAGNEICIYHAGVNRRYPPWRIGS